MTENTPARPAHKLAGFVYESFQTRTRRTLSLVFARFCEADQDPENLPEVAYNRVLQKDWPVNYPTLSAADIAEVLTEGMGGTLKYGVKRELAETMSAGQLATILLQMKEARARFESGACAGQTYLPVSKL